ncbi:MAG: hypothetical protein DHS20C11_10820 [Lysobacteraceae bacterium]|nr:MAG: hypothetical protein DHS20C11_10820 [Xanthomonadaceae bacterium]
MSTLIHQWVKDCRAGSNSRVIARLRSGWAVFGQSQFLHGYCLLLPDPIVGHLNEMAADDRQVFLLEGTLLGDALLAATGAARINYEILGNLEPALHLHIVPRYNDEPEHLRTKPVWSYDWENAPQFDEKSLKPLKNHLVEYLSNAGPIA